MTAPTQGTLQRTPLHDVHVALGAKIVPFAGFEMPVQYPTGITVEHKAVRESCGMFDVSHMGEVIVRGPDLGAAPRRVLTVTLQLVIVAIIALAVIVATQPFLPPMRTALVVLFISDSAMTRHPAGRATGRQSPGRSGSRAVVSSPDSSRWLRRPGPSC